MVKGNGGVGRREGLHPEILLQLCPDAENTQGVSEKDQAGNDESSADQVDGRELEVAPDAEQHAQNRENAVVKNVPFFARNGRDRPGNWRVERQAHQHQWTDILERHDPFLSQGTPQGNYQNHLTIKLLICQYQTFKKNINTLLRGCLIN